MTEATYFFGVNAQDGGYMPPISGYQPVQRTESYENGKPSQNYYSGQTGYEESSSAPSTPSITSPHHATLDDLATASTTQYTVLNSSQPMYDQHTDYTNDSRPGSPDPDVKDVTAIQQHHLLAKPVPMRRLSEKRIAQARATLGSTPDPNIFGTSPAIARAVAATQQPKRPRSEKKNIPDQQKDGKYFERRKRNNLAAKKSRDARKAREDEIAIRASFLEKENAILKAQVNTLREEANSLRQLLLQKRHRP